MATYEIVDVDRSRGKVPVKVTTPANAQATVAGALWFSAAIANATA